MTGKRAPTLQRFLSKLVRGDSAECWEWQHNKNGAGYGLIWDGTRRKKILAHRYSYEIHSGEVLPPGIEVVIMHTCDNPSCVNPDHLVKGTMKTNYNDMASKNRRRIVVNPTNLPPCKQGVSHPKAKLTNELVLNARARMAGGTPCRTMARELGINAKTMRCIRDRKGWTHI